MLQGGWKEQRRRGCKLCFSRRQSKDYKLVGFTLVCVLVAQSCPTLWDPTDCSPPGSSVHGIIKTWILEWVAFSSPRGLSNPGIKPGSPALEADSLLSELPGKPFVYYQKLLTFRKDEEENLFIYWTDIYRVITITYKIGPKR